MTTRKKLQVRATVGILKAPRGRRAFVLTDHEVELVRTLHEEHPRGHPEHMGYLRLALKFGVSKAMIRDICRYRKR